MSENKNTENYQRSFNKLHLSDDFRDNLNERLEKERKGKIMFNSSVNGISKIAAAIAISVITLGSAGICYACDLGGIRTNFELWLNGSKQTVEVEETEDGAYRLFDENGEERVFSGVYVDDDGNTEAMDAEQVVSFMNNDCQLEFDADGNVSFIYKNIKADVTKLIDNGSLHVHVDDPANANTYFDITGISANGYDSSSSDTPAAGTKYEELGTAVDDGTVFERDSDDNTGYSTTVIQD